jgi:hypothetical protein
MSVPQQPVLPLDVFDVDLSILCTSVQPLNAFGLHVKEPVLFQEVLYLDVYVYSSLCCT